MTADRNCRNAVIKAAFLSFFGYFFKEYLNLAENYADMGGITHEMLCE
jgi:hypothetical protein